MALFPFVFSVGNIIEASSGFLCQLLQQAGKDRLRGDTALIKLCSVEPDSSDCFGELLYF